MGRYYGWRRYYGGPRRRGTGAGCGALVLLLLCLLLGVVALATLRRGPMAPGPEPAMLGFYRLESSRASGKMGWNSSTGLPDGSSKMICLPPTPVTMSLRK